jgi:hypothetical protein
VEAMAEGKSPGLDGFAIQFYTMLWDLLGEEFTAMLQQAYTHGSLPSQVNHGLIILLHKGGTGKICVRGGLLLSSTSRTKSLLKHSSDGCSHCSRTSSALIRRPSYPYDTS